MSPSSVTDFSVTSGGGSSNPAPILVIGNSHTTAVAAAARAGEERTIEVVNLNISDREVGHSKLVDAEMVKAGRRRAIFSMFGGSEHLVLGLIELPQPFDLMTPTNAAIDPARTMITFSQMCAVLDTRISTARLNWARIRAAFDGPVWHIAPPPPFRALIGDPTLPAIFHEKLAMGVAPAGVRQRLHEAQLSVLRSATAAYRIKLVEPPRAVADEEGFLLERYWSREPTHANMAYGALVLDQIKELVDG